MDSQDPHTLSSTHPDLFDSPIIPGLRYESDFISRKEETDLINLINAQDMKPFHFQQWVGKRQVKSFGWHYDFQTGAVKRAEPLPGWLLPIRERAAAFASVNADEVVQALLIRYGLGAGIGWHKDRPLYDHVIGVSLKTPVIMRFRRRHNDRWQRKVAPLEPCAIYHLTGEARHDWEHSIVEMSEDTRYSLTFRTFSRLGQKTTANL